MPSPLFDLTLHLTHTPCSPASTSITNSITEHANAKAVRIPLMFPTPSKLLNDPTVQDDAVSWAHEETETETKYEMQCKAQQHALTESVESTPTDLKAYSLFGSWIINLFPS